MSLTISLAACLFLLNVQDPAPQSEPAPDVEAPDAQAAPEAPAADGFRPDPAWKPLGRDLWFDPEGRRLVIRAKVVLREGYLEHLLCLSRTKEHEAVLSTEASPRMIHAGLILAVGEPGHPVRYQPEFQAPEGPPVAITAEWKQGDELKRLDARELVKGAETGKPLGPHWIFAGSITYKDPETDRVLYAADGGDLITVANFAGSILDVPFASTSSDADLGIVAFTENIPPLETPVTLYLEKAAPTPKDQDQEKKQDQDTEAPADSQTQNQGQPDAPKP